ncbi:hypothetical protein AGLY_001176 [Aphis glycines]|uniref:Uncharacterized protein n=1 Tax=Aphis glycines TaxID=307491 RepID=A0A6G0U9K2_APHGL|nr:hypothetical protein AGLY_001176 [Aphis glycines]
MFMVLNQLVYLKKIGNAICPIRKKLTCEIKNKFSYVFYVFIYEILMEKLKLCFVVGLMVSEYTLLLKTQKTRNLSFRIYKILQEIGTKIIKVSKWVPLCCTLGGGVDLGLGIYDLYFLNNNKYLKSFEDKSLSLRDFLQYEQLIRNLPINNHSKMPVECNCKLIKNLLHDIHFIDQGPITMSWKLKKYYISFM